MAHTKKYAAAGAVAHLGINLNQNCNYKRVDVLALYGKAIGVAL